jgi:hypothetical protein
VYELQEVELHVEGLTSMSFPMVQVCAEDPRSCPLHTAAAASTRSIVEEGEARANRSLARGRSRLRAARRLPQLADCAAGGSFSRG